LSADAREERIVKILDTLVGDGKTTMQISRIAPYDTLTIKQILINLKSGGYVTTDPPICPHKGWVVWILTSLGMSRIDRSGATIKGRGRPP
jgi:hypothetical protein